jgi:hypothetical protein
MKMHSGVAVLLAALLSLLLVGAAHAETAAGTVVSIQGEAYVFELEAETAVSVGSILDVYRRLPDARGTALYRKAVNWWQMGRLKVVSLGDGFGVAELAAGPAVMPPLGFGESGAPVGSVQLGDKLRTTGAVAERPNRVRVSFARSDLFSAQDHDLPASGEAFLREWLRGLESMDGPIEVQVHARLPELGLELPDIDRTLSAQRDDPFGPAPATPVTPAEGLYERPQEPVNVPMGREVLVVQDGGARDTWHYVDPVTLARRQGTRVAGVLAASLAVQPSAILVTVVPRPLALTSINTPGYDFNGDQIRILASAISWSEPPPLKKKKKRKKSDDEDPKPKKRRRLLEQIPQEVSSAAVPAGGTLS